MVRHSYPHGQLWQDHGGRLVSDGIEKPNGGPSAHSVIEQEHRSEQHLYKKRVASSGFIRQCLIKC